MKRSFYNMVCLFSLFSLSIVHHTISLSGPCQSCNKQKNTSHLSSQNNKNSACKKNKTNASTGGGEMSNLFGRQPRSQRGGENPFGFSRKC